MRSRTRSAFDVTLSGYVAALVSPVVGEYAGILAYAAAFAGVCLAVYLATASSEMAPRRLARRPLSSLVMVAPLAYGFVYVVGEVVAETPITSPYVYLGIWNVVLGIAAVVLARSVSPR